MVMSGAGKRIIARSINEWHEEIGTVLWWAFPITEPPYCGTPLDTGRPVLMQLRLDGDTKEHQLPQMTVMVGGWPGYHTHWTPIEIPESP